MSNRNTTEFKIAFTGALVLLVTAVFSVGPYNYDEHFEILEYVLYKQGRIGADALTWEFHARISSGLLPFLAWIVDTGLREIGVFDPFRVTCALRLFSAFIGFLAALLFYRAFRADIRDGKFRKLFVLLSFFLWFIVFHHVRFSSEGLSGSLFALGLASYKLNSRHRSSQFVVAGILLALSAMIRYPVALLVLGFVMWLIIVRKERLAGLSMIALGVIVGTSLCLLTDVWLYGEFSLTPLNYIYENVILNKAMAYRSEPWWYYFWKVIELGVPPFSVLYVAACLLFIAKFRQHPVTWSLVPFLLILTIIPYKNISMLVPVFTLMPLVLAQSAETVSTRWIKPAHTITVRIFKYAFWTVHIVLLLAIMFYPASNKIYLFEEIYQRYEQPVTLYYTEAQSPYDMGMEMRYYQRPGFDVRHVASLAEVPRSGRNTLIATTSELPEVKGWQARLVYRSLPAWIVKLNLGNWVGRTGYWRVYELEPTGG